jgi:hypothetical protein
VRRKVLLWSVAVVLAIAAVLTTLTFTFFWRSPAYYLDVAEAPGEGRMMPKRDYRVGHPEPYVYRAGDALVFGSAHSRDPNHPQVPLIDRHWRELKPTVALVEGRLGFLFPGLMDPIRTYGEMGRVNALAKADGIPSYTWDPPWETTATELTRSHPRERVAIYYVLRPYFGTVRFGRPDSPEKFVEEYLDRASIPALKGSIGSVADIDRIWRRDFPDGPDWRDLSDEEPLAGWLSDIAYASEDLRNVHLIRVIHTLLRKGERVFVICGSSHAVVIEAALRT